ncbi:MAG: hypothetical protein VCB07_00930 [Gammaproteobacteria bacterium]
MSDIGVGSFHLADLMERVERYALCDEEALSGCLDQAPKNHVRRLKVAMAAG